MKKLSFLIAAAVAVAPAITSSQVVPQENRAQAAPGKVLLRLRLKAGQRYVTRISADNTITMNMAGQNRPMRQNLTMAVDTRVLAVAPGGTMATQMKIVGMKMAMNANGQKITMDSANARKGDPAAAMFGAIVGVPLTAQVTPSGKTLNIKGTDIMIRRMIATMSVGKSAPSAAQKKRMKAMMRKQISPEKLQMTTHNFYPPRAVGVGESWRIKSAVGSMMGGMTPAMDATYRLVKRAGGVSTISASGHFGAVARGGGAILQKTNGRQNLLLQVDEKTGLARLTTGTISVASQVMMGGAKPQKMTTRTQSRIHMTTSSR